MSLQINGEIMRCDQCKHWGEEADASWDAKAIGFRHCNGVRERWKIADEASDGLAWIKNQDDHSEKSENEWIKARSSALTAARAYVEDGSEYRATLITGPDFCCALFEEK